MATRILLLRRPFVEFHSRLWRVARKSAASLILLALGGAGIAGCRASSGLERNTPTTALAKIESASFYRFVPGQRLIYRLDYTSTSTSDFRALLQVQKPGAGKPEATPLDTAQSFKTTLHGEFTATVLNQNTDTAIVVYSLHDPDVSLVSNGQNSAEAAKIRQDLTRDIFASVSLEGRVLSVRFEPGLGELSQSFVRTLLAMTQFVLPPSQAPDLRQWETIEADPNGQYLARYETVTSPGKDAQVTSQSESGSFSKTKMRYLQSSRKSAPDEIEATTEIKPRGSLIGRFDLVRGYLISLDGKESQSILIDGKTVANAQNSLQMVELRRETLSTAELDALREANSTREKLAASVPLFVVPSEEASETSIERTELGDATSESLLADLSKREASASETNDSPLYLKFKALIYLHPEASANLGKILATADAKGPSLRILTGALSAVGNAEAQAALVDAIKARPTDWPALSLLIPALGESTYPTQASEDLLRDLAFGSPNPDIASTAQLSLGNMARRLGRTDPDRAAKVVRLFIKAIESSPSDDVTHQMFLALGNAGSNEAVPTISGFINNSSPMLRSSATAALRWVDSDQVDPMLVTVLTSDRDATVRLEAATALGFRKMSASNFQAQKSALLQEKDVKVRLAILSNLWRVQDEYPEVRQIVKQTAARDPSSDVRKAAAELMKTKTGGPLRN